MSHAVSENGAHYVADFDLAAVRERLWLSPVILAHKSVEPVLDGRRFDVAGPIISPARHNPPLEIRIRSFFGRVSLPVMAVHAQLSKAIVFSERLEGGQNWTTTVQHFPGYICTKHFNLSSCICLGFKLPRRSNNEASHFLRAVRLPFPKPVFPNVTGLAFGPS